MEPNWNWPNLENWPSEAMWSSILNAEQNLNSLNLFTGLWSHSLSAPFPTHPESTLLWEWLFSPGKRNFLLMWFMESLASFLSPGHLGWKKTLVPTKIQFFSTCKEAIPQLQFLVSHYGNGGVAKPQKELYWNCLSIVIVQALWDAFIQKKENRD